MSVTVNDLIQWFLALPWWQAGGLVALVLFFVWGALLPSDKVSPNPTY